VGNLALRYGSHEQLLIVRKLADKDKNVESVIGPDEHAPSTSTEPASRPSSSASTKAASPEGRLSRRHGGEDLGRRQPGPPVGNVQRMVSG
jgi:hypothetical protein